MINNDKIFSSENYNFDNEQSQEGISIVFKTIGILYLALFIFSKIVNKIDKHDKAKLKQFVKDNKPKLEKLKKFVDECLLEFNEICQYIKNNCMQLDCENLLNYDDIIYPFEKIISKNKNIDRSIIPYLNKHAKKISLYPFFYDHNSIDYDGKEFKDLINIKLPKFTKDLCNKKYKYFKILSNEKEIVDNICDGESEIKLKVDYSNLDIELLSNFINKE